MTTFVVVMLEVMLDGLRNNPTFYSSFFGQSIEIV